VNMCKFDLPYATYLLRIWPANATDNISWRAILVNPHTGERRGFPNLNALFICLEAQTGERLIAIDQEEL